MLSYNLSTVTKIRVFKKRPSVWYYWKPARTSFFGLIKHKEGVYYHWEMDGDGWQEKCPDNMYVEDKEVYLKPHVTMWFNDGGSRDFYFKTTKDAEDAAQKVKERSGCEWYEHK